MSDNGWNNPDNYVVKNGYKWWIPGDWIVGGVGGSRGGGGGGKRPTPLRWNQAGYTGEGAPSWWKGILPNKFSATTEYATIYNSMIPYLSPEDQRIAAQHLSSLKLKKSGFETYDPEVNTFGDIPTEVTSDITEKFTSSDRARSALQTLDKIAEVSKRKKEKFGAGYQYLRQLLTTMKDFGGGATGSGNRQTRAEFMQMQAALSPILEQFKSNKDLKPYAGLAQQLTSPYFTAGAVVPIKKDAAGNYQFGEGNKQLFG